jgi:hypothetical protein
VLEANSVARAELGRKMDSIDPGPMLAAASQSLQWSMMLMENANESDQYDFSVLFRASLAGGRRGARELD